MSNFRVGQKVVCVISDYLGKTIEGRVYTVSGVTGVYRNVTDDFRGPGITLHEVDVPHPHSAFDPRRFRPVVERKTDISIFRAMLNPSKQRADA